MRLLYGKDNEENIVAIEPLRGQSIVEVFTRDENGLSSRYETFTPHCYINDNDDILKNMSADVEKVRLFGNNHYNLLLKSQDISDLYRMKRHADDCFMPYLDSQYALQTGKTLFKGMEFEDPLVMFFDIETYTHPDFSFPNPARESDKIIMIAVRCNDGFEKVLTLDESTEYGEIDLIENFIELVVEKNPDILANHNIFNFDLNYLNQRCKFHNMSLTIGRNGSEPRTFETKIKFAEREREYINFDIYGRHVIDTQFLAEYADIVKREMPSYGLKNIVKYLGKADKNRKYIEGKDISWYWDNKRDELEHYALDDVREAEIVYNEFGQSIFKMTPMIPMSYQEVFRYGTGSQIEYVFIREYFRQQWSLPKPSEKREFSGGYADVLKFGLIREPIIYGDVKSLYPTLAKILKIQPSKDELKIFQKILQELMDIRFEIKDKIKTLKSKEAINKQKATDGSVKIFLNTMAFGFLGWEFGMFNDYNEAERITKEGQSVIKKMNKLVEEDGGMVVKTDTDGSAFVVPEKFRGSQESEEEYCKSLTQRMPDHIIIEHDGRYKGMLAVDKKSYAMMEYDGKMTIKGNTLRGRNVEPFVTDMVKECIKHLINGDEDKCTETYNYWVNRIKNREAEIEEIRSKKNLNMSLEEYKNKREAGLTPNLAQYELALASDTEYQKGDMIFYYIKRFPIEVKALKSGKLKHKKIKQKAYEAAVEVKHYKYDYEIDHYVERAEKGIKKFIILGKDIFEPLFDVKLKTEDKRKYKKVTGKEYENL